MTCRLDNTDHRQRIFSLDHIQRHRADGAAGNNNCLDVVLGQKCGVLTGIIDDGLASARAVRHAAGIAKINNVFVRHDAVQLTNRRQTA